jgi:AcrR family transcriptional regulator
MARPRNQEQRRTQLVDSTMTAIRERGLGSLRIRDVADAAGVATGTVHYYYGDLDRLLHEVHSKASDRFITARIESLDGISDAREQLTRMIASGLPTGPDDEMVVALYEIDFYKRDNPVHSQLIAALYDQQVAVYRGILDLGVSQGHFDLRGEPALDIARNLVALEDAYGLHIITPNRSLPLERCLALMVSFTRVATGCIELKLPGIAGD